MAWAVLVLVLAGCGPAPTVVGDPIVQSMAWRLDPGHQASLPDVALATDWQAFDGDQGWGFGHAPVWVRYRLRAASPDETLPWIVRVRPAFLEDLVLHDPQAGLVLHSGQAAVRKDDALGSIVFTFEVPPLPRERDIFLRIQTQSTRVVTTDVMPLREAVTRLRSYEWQMGLLLSISAICALWATAQWATSRERVMGAFALKQVVATAWSAFSTGFAAVLLGGLVDHGLLWVGDSLVRVWTVAATVWFLCALIEDYQPRAAWIKAGRSIVALLLALSALQFAGLMVPARMAVNACVPLGLAVCWLALRSASPSAQPQPIARRVLLAFLGVYTLINLPPALTYLGLLPFHPFALKGNLSHVVFDAGMMYLLLQLRARDLAARARRVADENRLIEIKLETAQKGIAFEQQRRREQSQFLHMLMHELKTPLSIVSLALGNRNNREENLAHAGKAVRDMKAIIDRCVQADQLGELRLTPASKAVDVVEMIRHQAAAVALAGDRLALAVPAQPPSLRTDPQLLRIILANLLDNAAHYGDPLTPVSVAVVDVERQGRPGVAVRVGNVPGLAGWPDADQLFTKYYRAQGAQRESGSGLGLHLSQRLAESLGGSLAYEPDETHVEFSLWIPRHPG